MNVPHIQLSGDSDPGGPGTTLGKLKPREETVVQSPAAEPQAMFLACCKDQIQQSINTRMHYYFQAGMAL